MGEKTPWMGSKRPEFPGHVFLTNATLKPRKGWLLCKQFYVLVQRLSKQMGCPIYLVVHRNAYSEGGVIMTHLVAVYVQDRADMNRFCEKFRAMYGYDQGFCEIKEAVVAARIRRVLEAMNAEND
jgi:hypothetical protein